MSAVDPNTGMVFESVRFLPDAVEVSFTDATDHGKGWYSYTTFGMHPSLAPTEYHDLIDSIRAFADAWMVTRRNPPDELHRG